MEASKRERIILLGVVPIVAAILGAITTVIISHATGGGGNQNDVMLEILRMEGLTFEQKTKLMQIADQQNSRFYTWLSSIGTIVLMAIGYIAPSVAQRIRER